jgi:hypothetical protein
VSLRPLHRRTPHAALIHAQASARPWCLTPHVPREAKPSSSTFANSVLYGQRSWEEISADHARREPSRRRRRGTAASSVHESSPSDTPFVHPHGQRAVPSSSESAG